MLGCDTPESKDALYTLMNHAGSKYSSRYDEQSLADLIGIYINSQLRKNTRNKGIKANVRCYEQEWDMLKVYLRDGRWDVLERMVEATLEGMKEKIGQNEFVACDFSANFDVEPQRWGYRLVLVVAEK